MRRWMKDLFKLGMKGPISPDAIYRPKSTLESKRNTDAFSEKWSDELKRNSPSILRAIFRIHGVPLLLLGISFSVLESTMRWAHKMFRGTLFGLNNNSCISELYNRCVWGA